MTNEEERMRILVKVEHGEMSINDAIGTLAGKNSGDAASEEVPSTPMEVLKALEDGKIGPNEATDRLGSQKVKSSPELEDNENANNTIKHSTNKDRIWLLPLWGGVGLVLLSAAWMASRLQGPGYDFWFFTAWLPLALGVLFISLAWASRNSPWLTLKIRSSSNGGQQRFNLHFHLPTSIMSWAVRHYKGRLKGVNMDRLESILAANGSLVDPIVIHARDDDGGDEVEVNIA